MSKKYLLLLVLSFLFLGLQATINTQDFPNKLTESLPEVPTSIPSNQELFDLINSLQQLVEEQKDNEKLDDKTKKLLDITKNLIGSSKDYIHEKNYDEAIQKFAEHAARISEMIAEEAKDKTGKIKEDLEQFSHLVPKLRRLVSEVITSNEFRKTIWATIHAFSDLFSRVASQSDSNLRRIEKSAQNVKEDLKATAEEGTKGFEKLKESAQQGAQKVVDRSSPHFQEAQQGAKKAVETEGKQGIQQTSEAGKNAAKEAVKGAHDATQNLKEGAQRAQPHVEGVKKGVEDLKNSAQNLGQDIKKTTQEGIQTATTEGKKLFFERIQPLLNTITRHKSYQEAVSEIQDLFDYFRNLKDNEVTSISPELRKELNDLSDEGADLIGRFTNGRNIKRTREAFWSLYNDLSADTEAEKYFSDLYNLFRDIAKNPTKYQDFDKVKDTFSDLYDRGTTIVQEKYGQRIAEFTSELSDIFSDFAQDNLYLSSNVREGIKVASDIVITSPLNALAQFRHLVTPFLKNFTKLIILPSFEGKEDDTYYRVENIQFQVDETKVDDIILDIIVGLKDKISVELKVTDLDLSFKDVQFHYEKSYVKDDGVFDAHLKFPSWTIRWSVNDTDSVFGNTTVDVQLDTLDVSITEAKHAILDKIFLSVFSSWIKEKIRDAIQASLTEPANTISQQFTDFFQTKAQHLQQQFDYSDDPWATLSSINYRVASPRTQ